MKNLTFFLALILAVSQVFAVGTYCGGAALADGSGTVTSSNGYAVVSFSVGTSSGSLSTSGNQILSSQRGIARPTLTGYFNTTCPYNMYIPNSSVGSVGIYRVDTGAYVSSVQTWSGSNLIGKFVLAPTELLASNGVYEVRVTSLSSSPCTSNVYNAYFSVSQPVCL